MKKLLMMVVAIVATMGVANAQTAKSVTTFEKGKNAIGLRFSSYSTEISYQKYIADQNRIEADLGWYFDGTNGIDLNLTYQWVMPFKIDKLNFNWYLGAGANVGVVSDQFLLGAVGQIGVEYNFNIPLSLSLDWRPTLRITPASDFVADGIALSVRYRF